jgi:hypothetical protein
VAWRSKASSRERARKQEIGSPKRRGDRLNHLANPQRVWFQGTRHSRGIVIRRGKSRCVAREVSGIAVEGLDWRPLCRGACVTAGCGETASRQKRWGNVAQIQQTRRRTVARPGLPRAAGRLAGVRLEGYFMKKMTTSQHQMVTVCYEFQTGSGGVFVPATAPKPAPAPACVHCGTLTW